ncbi:hypothetical protein [Flavobacterium sp.]|uniref:hypothetical protein n=1 Tax=Flavobacterium sp. TaxID=239 RepID=UPI004048623F
MENIEIINFLKEATYLDTIIVTKSNNTTTIIDTVNNVEFKSTYMPEYLKKFHCYFTNSEDI